MENFTKAMQFISKWEWMNKEDGAFTDHPADPGGKTKWGISQKAYPDLNIANLKKTDAYAIYFADYWLKAGCNEMEFPLACTVFDTAINMGVSKAKDFLAKTKDVKEYIELRTQRYLQLADRNPKLKVFLKGWLRRINDLKKFIES